MQESTAIRPRTCVGIDLGDRYSYVIVLDPGSGEVLEESRLPTTETAFRRRFEQEEAVRIAIEVGCHSPWVSRLLEELGHDVVVANALKLRLIHKNDSKTDRTDAEYLARLAAADPKLLHPVRHRGETAQADRSVLIARDNAVACRTKLIRSAACPSRWAIH